MVTNDCGLLYTFHGASFLAIVTLMIDFSESFGQRFLTPFLAGRAGASMGLVVSAFVKPNDRAIAVFPLLRISQYILSNSGWR